MSEFSYKIIFTDVKRGEVPNGRVKIDGSPDIDRYTYRVTVYAPLSVCILPILMYTKLICTTDEDAGCSSWTTHPDLSETSAIRAAIKNIDEYLFPWQHE